MTTAELRNAAREAASRCEWAEAARLMTEAVLAYPMQPGRASYTGAQSLDIAKMEQSIQCWLAFDGN